jgi:hypothetical protein
MKRQTLLTLLILNIAFNAKSQQVVRNLGFEQLDTKNNILSWLIGNTKQQYQIKLDTVIFHSGSVSVSMETPPKFAVDRGFAGVESIMFSPAFKTGKKVKISAYVKTQNMTQGFAGLAMRIHDANKEIGYVDSGNQGKSGNTDWSLCEIEIPLSKDVLSITFAGQTNGSGKAWFDDFQVSIDGKAIANSTFESKVNLFK